jgi:hypothetical protein
MLVQNVRLRADSSEQNTAELKQIPIIFHLGKSDKTKRYKQKQLLTSKLTQSYIVSSVVFFKLWDNKKFNIVSYCAYSVQRFKMVHDYKNVKFMILTTIWTVANYKWNIAICTTHYVFVSNQHYVLLLIGSSTNQSISVSPVTIYCKRKWEPYSLFPI